jgi:hypothetical protein
VLVLDDLHWAARPTLQLVLHVLRAAADDARARLLVVGTYRDTDIDRSHPLSDVLADLRRLPIVSRLAVDGLTADEVVTFAEQAAGHELDDATRALARTVHAETDGNAFFVGEVLRHLVEIGAVRRHDDRWVVSDTGIEVPEGVRDVVGRRVSRLSPDANIVLSVAAVVGREGDLDVVAEVVDLPDATVLDAFDEGVRARLLEETGADRYRFAHALVRTTLYDELSATRRRRLHRRIAEALEKLHRDDVVALAYHALQAGPDGGDASRAARYCVAAGDQALAARALADAETRFRQALEVLDDSGVVDEHVRLQAACGLGEALRDQAKPEYRELLLAASRDARAAGLTDLLVRAVLSNDRGFASLIGRVDDERVEMIEAALDAVDDEPSIVRARLVALLSQELFFGQERDRSRKLGAEAQEMARALGDPRTICEVIVRRSFSSTWVISWDDYLDLAREGAALADALGDPALRAVARVAVSGGCLATGDLDGCRRSDEEMRAAAAEGSPALMWLADSHNLKWTVTSQPSAVALADADAVRARGEAAGEPDHLNWWAAVVGHVITLRDGSSAAIADVADTYAAQYPGAPTWRITHALALADAGRRDEAEAVLDQYGVDPRALADEPFPYLGTAGWAQLAYTLGRRDMAETAVELLTPHVGRWAHYFLSTYGPVDGYLGVCESVLGHHERAVSLLSSAVEGLAEAGMVAVRDWTACWLAEVLVGAGDVASARSVLEEVIASTTVTGAEGLCGRAQALLDSL